MRKQPNRKQHYTHKTNGGKSPEEILKKFGMTREQVATLALLNRPGILKRNP